MEFGTGWRAPIPYRDSEEFAWQAISKASGIFTVFSSLGLPMLQIAAPRAQFTGVIPVAPLSLDDSKGKVRINIAFMDLVNNDMSDVIQTATC